MKKLIVLFAFFTLLFVSKADAQAPQGGDPAAAMQRYKDRVKPQLIEKAKITDAEADKVIAISFSYRGKMRDANQLGEEEKKKQLTEIQESLIKEYTAIPLTEVQVKAVTDFFEEQRKEREKRQQNGGNGK